MANTSKYLQSNPYITLRDYQHASRLFVDDNFRLAPKSKFLFHVSFSINSAALKSIDLVQRHRNEINMLVKSADLPKFTLATETMNQYNRKKVVQNTHKFETINIKFHDDNMSLINQLWQNYYTYYYADANSATVGDAYNRNATRSSDFINNRYGLDNKSSTPFFNSITIYQMAKHEYVSYTLRNPLITSWSHGAGQYQGNELNEKAMGISFEAVAYGNGKVTEGDPMGFGLEHYDQTPSPLFSGGTLDTASPSFVSGVNIQDNAREFLNTVTTQINTYQNTKELPSPGTSGVLTSAIQSSIQGVSGVQGIVFPQQSTTTAETLATKINLG
jgi:hypothetical protein